MTLQMYNDEPTEYLPKSCFFESMQCRPEQTVTEADKRGF